MQKKRLATTSTTGLLLTLILLGSLLPIAQPASGAFSPEGAAAPDGTTAVYRGVSTAVRFDISPPLRDIPPVPVNLAPFEDLDPGSGLEGPLGPQDMDPIAQTAVGPGAIPAPSITFDGFSNQLAYTPPDPVGDVGPDHYVAMANVHFAVYDKSGNLLYGPFANNTLWSGFGGPCETENAGDPIVLYDQLADRWMLTQFSDSTAPWYNCVALSTTPDPTGSYYRWAFATPAGFPDYPKYAVWPDAYYISTREFDGPFVGVGAYALNRAQMLAGNPAPQVVSFLVPPGSQPYNVGDGLLPSDLDGTALPPAGSPNYYLGSMDNGASYGAPQDALTLWHFHVDWAVPGNSSFTLVSTMPTAAFDSIFPCTPGARDCIPQPGTTEKVDILSYRQRPLWRLAYRNMGGYETMVTNQSVEASTGMAGIRWYEVRDPNGTPTIYQQGTYNPGASDSIHRWMGSIAMDHDGNMMLGYSASSATSTYPSSWYTGRLATDPLGTLPQGEGVFVNGLGSQLSTGSRWGDYTSMNVDPVDDCTFWYINEYYPTTSATAWRLHIGAVRYPSCGSSGADLSVVKTATPDPVAPGGTVTYTLDIVNAGPDPISRTLAAEDAVQAHGTVTVTDDLPAGVTVNTVVAPGWTCSQAGQQLTCTTPSLPVGAVQIGLVATAPLGTGYITNSVTIASNVTDTNPANNWSYAVTLVDVAPLAHPDSYTATEDTALVVAAPGVLGNDVDSDPLTAALDVPPAHGTVLLNADGSFTYTPALDYAGADGFSYLASDGYLTASAAVAIVVTPVNDAPVAHGDSYSTPEDTALVVAAPGVLDNDSDVDGDPLSAALESGPQHGTVALALDGSFVYTPTADYAGADSFAYIASDGVLTDGAVVSLTIVAVNDAPRVDAGADQEGDEGAALSFAGTFIDPDGPAGPAIAWHWGDGWISTGTLTPTYTYADEGLYAVTLIITDGLGAAGWDTLAVTVSNVAPELAPLADLAVELGQAVTLSGSFGDPGWLDLHRVTIAWGDGLSETQDLVAGLVDFSSAYTYTAAGVYTATVTVDDHDGGVDSLSFVVTVSRSTFTVYLPILYKG